MIKSTESLFDPNVIYISSATTREDVFKEVSENLVHKGYVKPAFFDNLNTRENEYPTGIDLSVVDKSYPNVAIPHTEANFVYKRCIVPVKLSNPIEFNNMIEPSKKFKVQFLFMILNNDPVGQANVLAEIMDFLTTTNQATLFSLFESDSESEIYKILTNNFKEI